MADEGSKDDLWRELKALNEGGDIKAALMLASETALRDDPRAQRYAGWIHFQNGDFVKASGCYVEAARQRSHEAIDECYACARQLDASGMHMELVHLCESHPLATMEKFQRLMRSHYHRTGDAAQLLAWSVLVADHGAIDDLLYVADLYLSAGNPDGAMRFAEAAAAQGSGKDNQILGEIYWQGIGVKSDKALASIYYEKAARSGLLVSQMRLLHLDRSRRGAWYIPMFTVRLIWLGAKATVLTTRDASDPRLAHLPLSGKCLRKRA